MFLKNKAGEHIVFFYDNEIIKEQGEDRIKTITNFVKIEKGVILSSKSYKSSCRCCSCFIYNVYCYIFY